MTNLQIAFQNFEDEPTAIHAWELQQAMVAHANLYLYQVEKAREFTKAKEAKQAEEAKKAKQSKQPKPPIVYPLLPLLKTEKGGKWCDRLKSIVRVFSVCNVTVKPLQSRHNVEAWILDEKVEGQKTSNKAILYLSSDGFTIGEYKCKPLQGFFEGYDDLENFRDFLTSNDIETE